MRTPYGKSEGNTMRALTLLVTLTTGSLLATPVASLAQVEGGDAIEETNQDAADGASTPTQDAAPEPKATPAAQAKPEAPEATPAATPAATPVPPDGKEAGATDTAKGSKVNDPNAKDSVPAKELTREEREALWHKETPAGLSRRLALGFAVGFGTGSGPESRYSADRMNAQAFVQYAASELSPGQMNLLVEGQYAGITGVNTDLDESQSVQYVALGAGIDWYLAARQEPLEDVATRSASDPSRMRLQGILSAGLSKRKGLIQETGAFSTPKYGATIGAECRYLYAVWNRIEAYTGLGARFVGYSSYDAKVGFVAGF